MSASDAAYLRQQVVVLNGWEAEARMHQRATGHVPEDVSRVLVAQRSLVAKAGFRADQPFLLDHCKVGL